MQWNEMKWKDALSTVTITTIQLPWWSSLLVGQEAYICRTIRASRKYLCQELVRANLKVWEIKATKHRQYVKLCKWKDKRDVLTLSTEA